MSIYCIFLKECWLFLWWITPRNKCSCSKLFFYLLQIDFKYPPFTSGYSKFLINKWWGIFCSTGPNTINCFFHQYVMNGLWMCWVFLMILRVQLFSTHIVKESVLRRLLIWHILCTLSSASEVLILLSVTCIY